MSDDEPHQETLAATRARLNLDGPPAPPETIDSGRVGTADESLDPGAPPVPGARRAPRKPRAARAPAKPRAARPRTPRARTPARVSTRRALVTPFVVAGVVVLGVVGFGIVHGVADRGSGSSAAAGAWKNYPGTAYDDSSEVLAAPSREATVASAEAFLAEYRDSLTAELGLVWTPVFDGSRSRARNGYGARSLLYDYSSAQWQGSAVMDRPDARQKSFEIFSRVAAKYGSSRVWLANAVYKDDPAEAKKQFGGTTRATQPVWRFYGDDAIADGATVTSEVLDLGVRRAPTFTGDYLFDLDDVAAGSVVVTVSVSVDSLLAVGDRDEFRRRLAAYDENDKPEPH